MKKKIAYCTPSLYIPGGVERVLTTKANYFADVLDYDIYIILTDGKGKSPYYPLSPKIHVINLDINFEELWHCSFMKKSVLYLKKQRIYRKRLETVLFDIKPDITISLLRREINFITSIKDGSKKLGEIHVNKDHYRNFESNTTNVIKHCFSIIWQKQLINKLKRLEKFIVLTEDDKNSWNELQNIDIIPNPIAFVPKRQATTLEKQIISVGRFSFEKGFDMLIEAWKTVHARNPEWQLKIYGSGNKEHLPPLIKEANLENSIIAEDAVPDIYNAYLNSSIYVCSSRFEGFGMVLAEAMSCGIPCVSFDCPHGPRNIIRNKEDGILVENGNIPKLAQEICFLIENEQLRKKMGNRASQNIQRLNICKIALQWEHIFKSLMEK